MCRPPSTLTVRPGHINHATKTHPPHPLDPLATSSQQRPTLFLANPFTVDTAPHPLCTPGHIIAAEAHPDSDKLYVETIDVGEPTPRQVSNATAGGCPYCPHCIEQAPLGGRPALKHTTTGQPHAARDCPYCRSHTSEQAPSQARARSGIAAQLFGGRKHDQASAHCP
jgi:hypothetical protein